MMAKVIDIITWGRLTDEQQSQMNAMYREAAAQMRAVAARFNTASEVGRTIYITDAFMAGLVEDLRTSAEAHKAADDDRLKVEILMAMKELAEAQRDLLVAIARDNGSVP